MHVLWALSDKEWPCQCRRSRRCRFSPWVGKIPWRRKRLPNPVFLPGEFHGQRSLAGHRPWGHKELDTTKQLTHTLSAYVLVCKVGATRVPGSEDKRENWGGGFTQGVSDTTDPPAVIRMTFLRLLLFPRPNPLLSKRGLHQRNHSVSCLPSDPDTLCTMCWDKALQNPTKVPHLGPPTGPQVGVPTTGGNQARRKLDCSGQQRAPEANPAEEGR